MAGAPAAANTRAETLSQALTSRRTPGPTCSERNAAARSSMSSSLHRDRPEQFGEWVVVRATERHVVLPERSFGLSGVQRDPGAQPLVADFQVGVRAAMLEEGNVAGG